MRGFLEASPALAKEIANVRRYEIELKNGIVIAVHSNSFRTVRGRTLVACVFDEVSFWKDETSAAPDVEVYRAVLPALATTRGMLIGISTPYRKFGLLHQKHRDHFGINDDGVLVVQGASKVFNPSLDDIVIDAQRAADPTSASAEWDAEFRADIATFLNDELIDRAVEHDRPPELPPAEGVVYQAFTDPSGGVGSDSYTVAIGHKAGECPRSINAEPTGLGTRWRPPGVKLGGPKLAEVCRIGHRTQAEQADRFAANMRPVIEQIRKSGITSLRGIAAALNARGVPTARGGTLDAGPDHGN